jgi:hypothetical protein
MPGKTGPIERRLCAVYSQVAPSIVTRAFRPFRAEGSWSIRWWVTATCPGPRGPVVATRQGGGGPKGAPQPLMWQRLVVAPPGVFGPATACRSKCQREDCCRWATALLPSGQLDDAVRPFPSSSLPRVCVDAPARLSLRFAHASGRPVSLTQDVRHARNSGEFWKDHNLGRLAHRVEVHNEEHQRCLCERAHLVREDS